MQARSALIILMVALLGTAQGKVFSRCELVRQLRSWGSTMPATWTCIANFESGYNTAAIGGPNTNGTYDHGIWQINDNYWCYNPVSIL